MKKTNGTANKHIKEHKKVLSLFQAHIYIYTAEQAATKQNGINFSILIL